jgi:hypothetical protein
MFPGAPIRYRKPMKHLLALVALLAFAVPQALPAADAPTPTTAEQHRAKEVWITRTGQRYHRVSPDN